MRRRLSALRKDESGFTLTELLIVIVILGVLAGIVIFSVQFMTDRGKLTACRADKKSAEVAVEAYYATNGTWPAEAPAGTATTALVPTYLAAWPGQPGNYAITYTGATHAITSSLGGC